MNRTKAAVLAIMLGCILVVILLIIAPNFQLLTYTSTDMEPTIGQNETIVITKRFGNLKRGDIVIFKYPADQSQRFIKRVVGLPGEVVAIREGRVFVDQKPLQEKYLDPKFSSVQRTIPEYRISPGTYYVLGDNRDASNDSRYWGSLPEELIYGRVIFK